MKQGWMVVLLLIAAALAGCGDDGDDSESMAGNGGGGTVLGQPSGTKGSSLDKAGAEATCASIGSTSAAAIGVKPLCVLAGLFGAVTADGLDVEKCNMLATECESAGGPPDDDAEAITVCVDAVQSCDLPVDDIQACISAGVAATSKALNALTCEGLAEPSAVEQALADFTSASEVAACKSLTASCPDLDPFSM